MNTSWLSNGGMRLAAAVVFGCMLPGSAPAQTYPLLYRPVTAEYSTTLDRIVLIAANPNQLHIYDPTTQNDVAVNLLKPPLSLSISLDGTRAAVGHDALISIVNLLSASVEKTLSVSATVNSVVMGSDWVYILSYNSGTTAVQISTGAVVPQPAKGNSPRYYGGAQGRMHPSGTAIYTTDDGSSPDILQDVTVSTGPVTNVSDGPYWGEYPVCGGVWFSPDGSRVYTGCGTAFQALPQNPVNPGNVAMNDDGVYWTTLSGAPQVRSLSESAAAGRVAVVPASLLDSSPPVIVSDSQVLLYDSIYLDPAGVFQLPGFAAGNYLYPAHGQQVFYNSTGTALYVVMQADSSSGLLNDFAIQVYPLTGLAACAPAFSSPSVTAAATGTIGTVSITAPASCIYQASSTANWIQAVSGAYGSGNGVLTYIIRPNQGATARTGTIMLGSQSFTITQFAPSSAGLLTELSFSVVGADYSKTLDRAILLVASPKELHVYDPVAGADQIVNLPKVPLCLSVSPDGKSVAVGYDGWVSVVDLTAAAITKTYRAFTDVHSIALGGTGYIYAYPLLDNSYLFNIATATGNMTAVTNLSGGRYPRVSFDDSVYYTEAAEWDISQGLARQTTGYLQSGICAPFWLTEGWRMITSCGKAYVTIPASAFDLQYLGSFSAAPSIRWADESVRLYATLVIPGTAGSTPQGDTSVQIYGDEWVFAGSFVLPSFNVGSASYPGHGRYVFWDRAEDRFTVVEQADSTAQLTADYGVAVYSLTAPAAGCSFALDTYSASFHAEGGVGYPNVYTGSGCIWQAASTVSWITVVGAAGFGASSVNTLAYFVSTNTSPVARTGSLTIGGQTLTVTQAGATKVGIFRSGFLWLLDQDGNRQFDSPPDRVLAFGGIGGDVPITGDWSGTGTTKIGIYRASNGLFLLDYNGNGTFDGCSIDRCYQYFPSPTAGDVPVTGDWIGSGTTKIGIYRPGTGQWFLNTTSTGIYTSGDDLVTNYGGLAGDVPVTGDWTGSGITKIGIFRAGFLWILNITGSGTFSTADEVFPFGGIAGDVPVVGDWSGTGASSVGVFRLGFFWVLDTNGDHVFTPGVDQAFAFGGIAGDKPVAGDW